MKKLLLTGVALVALTCGVFAQGYFNLNNAVGNYQNGVTVDTPGNYYTGVGGLEVWEANSATAAQISAINGATSGVGAYALLGTSGFTLEKTFTGLAYSVGGIGIGAVQMPDVSPAGATVAVGLAAWNTADTTANNAIANATATSRLGVYAFSQPTTDYNAKPTPTPPDLAWGLNTPQGDLVMTAIPEPGTFALAGLGAAALLIFRCRK